MAAAIDKSGLATLADTVATDIDWTGNLAGTHALQRGSPAQRSAQVSDFGSDQRGVPRHAIADAGAFELIEPELAITVSENPLEEAGTVDFGTTRFDAPVTFTVTIMNAQTSEFTTGPLVLDNVSLPTASRSPVSPATRSTTNNPPLSM